MTTVVALYNHKGGVSKTTTTFNLAHALSEHLGKKVLIVDGDPQCNMTELATAPLVEELDEQLKLNGDIGELPGTSVLEALAPRFHGDRANVDTDSIQLLQPDVSDAVYLFRGDVGLNEAEDYLSAAHSQRLGNEIHQRRNYVAIYDMLQRLGVEREFDFILIDVGPSAGALTRSFFLACDQFLIPTAPDRFNYQAIGSLSTILARWIEEHRVAVPDFERLQMNVPPGLPSCRGLIVQRFQRYAGKPKAGFRFWLDRLPERVVEELFPALQRAAKTPDVVPASLFADPTVAQIPDFSSLAPMMLTYGKPVWRLTQEDTGWTGSVWTQGVERMAELKELFFALAEHVAA